MANFDTFFRLVLGRNSGYLCIATLNTVTRKFSEKFFEYPKQLSLAEDFLDKVIPETNVYFCPNLFNKPRRIKENVISTPSAWSDLDRCNPANLLVRPSVVLESSPNRYQGFWLFDDEVEPEDAEDISRRIAYYHKEDGADISGWDLTQLLRVPKSINFKYSTTPEVKIIKADKSFYRLEDFEVYPLLKQFKFAVDELPIIPERLTGKILLDEGGDRVPPVLLRQFDLDPEDGDWSQALWFLENLA